MSIEIHMSNVDEIKQICDKGMQTEKTEQNESKSDQDIIDIFMKNQSQNVGIFRHLTFANQTYWQHFCDSFGYCKTSLCASFYFFCHAFFPDIFEQSGSKSISDLHDKISLKYTKRMLEIRTEIYNKN